MAKEMGQCPFSSEVFNCSAPETGEGVTVRVTEKLRERGREREKLQFSG